MSSNREERIDAAFVHIYLAMARVSQGSKAACIRSVDKSRGDELAILEAKLKVIGGYWRIHKTVNARDVEKARRWLICRLINHPEKAAFIDSEWRTALLQPDCVYGAKRFMLDIDSQDFLVLDKVKTEIHSKGATIFSMHQSPKGWHYITTPFDTREVTTIPDVTLLRDGYYFVKEVNRECLTPPVSTPTQEKHSV